MQLISTTGHRSLARVFALVALLCTGALQVQEAGHDHWGSLDDSYSQCLVCKTNEAAAPSRLPFGQPPALGPISVVHYQQATIVVAALPFQARGPPSIS